MLTTDSSVLAPFSPEPADSIPFSGLGQAFLLSFLSVSWPTFTNLLIFKFGVITTLLTLNLNVGQIQKRLKTP